MLSTIERMLLLKDVPFFKGMTVEQLQTLAGVCAEESFSPEATIYREGERGGALYVIVSGQVALERQAERKGSTTRLATVAAHSSFGEESLFDAAPRDSGAVAVNDTLLLRLSRDPLIALARQNPELSLQLIDVLSQRLREANDQIARLTRSRPREIQRLYDQLGTSDRR